MIYQFLFKTLALACLFLTSQVDAAVQSQTKRGVCPCQDNVQSQHTYVLKLNDQTFPNKAMKGLSIIDFYSDNCAPCRQFNPVFGKVAIAMHSKLNFYKLDIEEGKSTAKKFAIKKLPTILILREGNVIAQHYGKCSEEELKQFINSALTHSFKP